MNGSTAATMPPLARGCRAVLRGLEHEMRKRRMGPGRALVWLSKKLGITEAYARALICFPLLRGKVPPLEVRRRIEALAVERDWPSTVPVSAWLVTHT